MKILISSAMEMVLEELALAMKKYPTWPTDPIHAAAIVQEECGELIQACIDKVFPDLNNKGDNASKRAFKEAIQTAAMALRFIVNWPYEDMIAVRRKED